MIIPHLEFVFAAEARLAAPIQIGATYEGPRRIIPILEGNFEGPDIKGIFVPAGAADWQYVRGDGVTQAEATYAIQTDDAVVIQVQNFGLRSDTTFGVGQDVFIFWDAENARVLTE